MARRRGTLRYGLALWAGMLALGVALGVIGFALRGKGGLQTATNVAQLVSVVLAVPSLAVPLWLWKRRSTAPVAVTSETVAKATDILAGLVDQQWRTEATLRSLDDPDPIPVQWRLTHEAQVMDHPANLTPTSLPLTASSADIATLVAEFRRMRRARLVILGGPGTGKTTLAVQVLRELLATRRGHPGAPVPVLLSAAGWDTEAFPRLHDWLAARLAQDYPALLAGDLGREMPAILATRGYILPMLDGLDELPPAAQAAVITALNRSLSDTDQFVMTSRTAEYGRAVRAAGDVLTSAVVIEPAPLNPLAAAVYLRRCLPPRPGPVWERILTDLRGSARRPGPAAALAEITATPLGLWLLRAVYISPRTDPAPLLRFPDPAVLRAHLFEQLIPARIQARPPSDDPADLFRPRQRHDPARARRWLGYLAHHLSHLPAEDGTVGTRDFLWWRLARDVHAITPKVGQVFGMAFGFLFGVFAGFVVRHGSGAVLAIGGGFGFGLALGWLLGLAVQSWSREPPGYANLRLRGRASLFARRFVRWLGLALALVLTAGPALGFVLGLGLTDGLAVGSMFVLTTGFTFGLIEWAEAPTPTGQANTPLTNWRADRSLNLIRAVTFGLSGGLAVLIAAAMTVGLTTELVAGLVTVLLMGFTFGIVSGKHHAWMAYLIATYRLARAGHLPRALMPFLDDAHRLGLLRAVGPVYQFRHAELQDHLAATYHLE